MFIGFELYELGFTKVPKYKRSMLKNGNKIELLLKNFPPYALARYKFPAVLTHRLRYSV